MLKWVKNLGSSSSSSKLYRRQGRRSKRVGDTGLGKRRPEWEETAMILSVQRSGKQRQSLAVDAREEGGAWCPHLVGGRAEGCWRGWWRSSTTDEGQDLRRFGWFMDCFAKMKLN